MRGLGRVFLCVFLLKTAFGSLYCRQAPFFYGHFGDQKKGVLCLMGTAISTKGKAKPELMIFVAAFSAFLATFNETFLNVAFPAIMSDLSVGIQTVQWLSTAYMLGAAVMVPVSAFAYRSVPTKRLYLGTVGLLIVGSVIGAVAPNFSVLLIGRIVQALGTGMLIPIGMNITLAVAPKRKLGAYMGIMGAMTTLGPSSSVVLAGVLLSVASWQMMLVFFGLLSMVCFLCGYFFLDNIAELTHPKLDVASAGLIGLALICMLYGVSTIFSGGVALSVGLIVVGMVLLAVFVKRQQKLAQPLIDLRPLAVKPFALGVVINMFSLIIIFAMNIVTPMFLQSGLGISALGASLTLFPAILLSCVVSPVAGQIYDKRGARLLLPLGFALICLACVAISFAHRPGSLVILMLVYIPIICGSALIIGPLQSLALSTLSFELNPHGVTVMSTGFQIAGCIGASLFTGVYALPTAPAGGFTAAALLAAAVALVGFLLALVENRLSQAYLAAQKGSVPKNGIAAIMTHDTYSISVHATALNALQAMSAYKTTGLPVIDDDGQVAGFISDGDILRYMIGKDSENYNYASMYPLWHNNRALDERLAQLGQIAVTEFATKKVIAVHVSDEESALFKVFADNRIKKVPVVDGGKLVGVISRSDLIRNLLSQSSLFQANA